MVKRIILLLLLMNAAYASCSTILVGVRESDNNYEGVLANLTVEVRNGTGNVWVDTMPLTRIETQVSARLAKEVSCDLLGMNCSNLDFYYLLRSDYPLVGGPSAGATMTACTMAALLDVPLKKGIAVTGTINPDGSIGPVSSIDAKARALKGYDYFLVPQDTTVNASVSRLKIIKVNDIREVFKRLTGYDISPVNSSINVTSTDYERVMKIMDESLLSTARSSLNGSAALDLLNRSQSLYASGDYYSSASYAVRSLIYSYYESVKIYNNSAEMVANLINNISSNITSFKDSLQDIKINHIYDMESFAITMDRVREAQDLVRQAINATNSSLDNALFLASFAKVRLMTAKEWSTLLDYFNDTKTMKLDIEKIRPLVLDRMEGARNSIAYAETLVSPLYLSNAVKHLNNAARAFNDGEYVFSLFESLKARAEANLIMELNGFKNLSSRVSFKKELAERAISNSMGRGYLPLLSLSFLEYSRAFENDTYQQLLFLAYAREFSSLGYSLNDYLCYKKPNRVPLYHVEDNTIINYTLILILGFLIGLIVTLKVSS